MPNESSLLDILLLNRGLKTEAAKKAFLNPEYELMYDPFLMHDMEKAVLRIKKAIDENEKIVLYGDYDCDGIPGTVLLFDLFNKINYKNVEAYIPDRHTEGYGLNIEAVNQFIANNVALIITIDLGITNVNEVAHAKKFGIDVIVTDHHLPQENLPDAFALVNPKLVKKNGEKYPDPMLCGAGVAFKLVQAFLKKYGEEYSVPVGWEKWLLDMAGLATLADLVPLKNENRILAYYGMKVMRKTRRPGLLSLLRKMNIEAAHLTEEDLTFMVCPRLNAASRMDSPRRAFELLSETEEMNARMLADHLTKINDERKYLVAHIMKDVKKSLEKREEKNVIVIGNPTWRTGVLGLVAGKIVDEFKKPAFVWGRGDEEEDQNLDQLLRGSCRSNGSVNLVDLMTEANQTNGFSEFGGHELAGGFAITHEQVHTLEEKLCASFEKTKYIKEDSEIEGKILHDHTLSFDDVHKQNYRDVEMLAPFGMANPRPQFLFANALVTDSKLFGKEKTHLELCFQNSRGQTIKAISFFGGEKKWNVSFEKGNTINLIATLELSHFAGREELRLRIVDMQ